MRNKLMFTMFLTILLLGTFSTIPKASAWQTSFKMENMSSRYYVTPLSKDDVFYTEVSALYFGVFELFIIGERPKENYLLPDGQIAPELFDLALTYNMTSSGPLEYDEDVIKEFGNRTNAYKNKTTLEYTAPWDGLFYLIILLRQGGPDFFHMNVTHEMNPFFIPFISGYPTEIIGLAVAGGIFIIYIREQKKKKNIST